MSDSTKQARIVQKQPDLVNVTSHQSGRKSPDDIRTTYSNGNSDIMELVGKKLLSNRTNLATMIESSFVTKKFTSEREREREREREM